MYEVTFFFDVFPRSLSLQLRYCIMSGVRCFSVWCGMHLLYCCQHLLREGVSEEESLTDFLNNVTLQSDEDLF